MSALVKDAIARSKRRVSGIVVCLILGAAEGRAAPPGPPQPRGTVVRVEVVFDEPPVATPMKADCAQDGWSRLNLLPDRASLVDLWVVAPNDVWAFSDASGGGRGNAGPIHWDGCLWSRIEFPGKSIFQWTRMAVRGARDIWLLGWLPDEFESSSECKGSRNWPTEIAVSRWSGGSWSNVSVPCQSTSHTSDYFIAQPSSTDVWLRGDYLYRATATDVEFAPVDTRTVPGQKGSVPSGVLALVRQSRLVDVWWSGADEIWGLRDLDLAPKKRSASPNAEIVWWNGTVWKTIALPRSIGGFQPTGIWAAGERDVWVSGLSSRRNSSVILRWDGSGWSLFDLARYQARRVRGDGSGGIWVIGDYFTEAQSTIKSSIAHYDQGLWGISYNVTSGDLGSIWAPREDDIWVVGGRDRVGDVSPFRDYHSYNVVLHWDGTSWINRSAQFQPAGVLGIWGAAPNDAWTVGHGGIAHWDGVSSAPVESVDALRRGALRGIWGTGRTTVWTVGDRGTILHWNGATWTAPWPGRSSRTEVACGLVLPSRL